MLMAVQLLGLLSELVANVGLQSGNNFNSPARIALGIVTFVCGALDASITIWRSNILIGEGSRNEIV